MATRFNLMQQSKVPAYLKCFRARAGHKLVQSDISSLEPTILAEFSRDPSLWKLYSPQSPSNDVYLFNAANIPYFSEKIRRFYDPENPTPESIALAKKECKKERGINKVLHLAAGYGASAKRVHQIFTESGIVISFGDVLRIHKQYWQLYAGIKVFQRQLEAMWEQMGGYIINARGRPFVIPQESLHNAVAIFCQSSGHDCLHLFMFHIDRLRKERQIPLNAWMPDYHDETIWEVEDEFVPEAVQILRDAIACVNEEFGMDVVIKAEPQIANNLADIKCGD